MASLNLVPNPSIIGIQAGIFLMALLVVRKYFVEPYQKIRTKRRLATVGSSDLTQSMALTNEKSSLQIKDKLDHSMQQAQKIANDIKFIALKQRDELIANAEKEAQSTLKLMRSEILEDLSKEKSKIPDITKSIVEAMYNQAIN